MLAHVIWFTALYRLLKTTQTSENKLSSGMIWSINESRYSQKGHSHIDNIMRCLPKVIMTYWRGSQVYRALKADYVRMLSIFYPSKELEAVLSQ